MDERKSTTVYYLKFNGRCAALSRCVKKLATVSSSSEAQCQGVAAAVQEARCLKQHLQVFGIQKKHPIAIGADNQSFTRLCQNKTMHKRSKRIEKKSLHSGLDGKWDYFISIRSYWHNGSKHLYEILARIEVGNIKNSFDEVFRNIRNLNLPVNQKRGKGFKLQNWNNGIFKKRRCESLIGSNRWF